MTRTAIACAVLAIMCLPPLALAQEPDPADGRYAMSKTDDGFLRLDTRTGMVSVCRRKATDWVCESVADERAMMEREITRLEQENGELRERIARLEKPAEPAEPQAKEPGSPETDKFEFELPSKQDMDKVMTFFEDVMRRLRDMVKSMEQEKRQEQQDPAKPDRT